MLWAPMARLVLIAPNILKPPRRQLGVLHRVLHVAMAQEELHGPRILFVVGQLKTAAMPQLMGAHREAQPGPRPRPRDHLPDARIRQRAFAFREKDVGRIGGGAALQLAQGTNLGWG